MEGITGDFDALVVKDLYSKVKVLLPVRNKTAEQATRALRYFFGNNAVGRFYSDIMPPSWSLRVPLLELCTKRLELAFPKIIPSSSVLTSTSLSVIVPP